MPSLFYAGQPDYIEKLNTLATAASMTNGTVAASFLSLAVTGTATAASFVGPLTGNASTATTLATARNINGVSFNGSADITVTAAAGTLTGATLAAGVTASSLTSVGTLSALTVSGQASITANSASAALTVTQTGAGNAFVVEDAASDTTPFVIDGAGQIGFGETALTGYAMRASIPITGAVNGYGLFLTNEIQSGVTTTANVFSSQPATAAAAFTLGELRHFFAQQYTIGSGSTVTNQYGFYAHTSLTLATNNFGFYSNIAAAANRYNFYASGTADNFFAGNVGIGDLPSAGAKLRVGTTGTGTDTSTILAQGTTPASSTHSVFYALPTTSATTLNALMHFFGSQSTLTGMVTNQYVFRANSNVTGATNNYGFYSEIASGANRYNFYAAGTASNYFGGLVECANYLRVFSATATPAGGAANTGLLMGSAVMGVYFGSGAPTVSAAKGSLYLRSDGSTTNDRMYVNTNGSTTWTAVITAA